MPNIFLLINMSMISSSWTPLETKVKGFGQPIAINFNLTNTFSYLSQWFLKQQTDVWKNHCYAIKRRKRTSCFLSLFLNYHTEYGEVTVEELNPHTLSWQLTNTLRGKQSEWDFSLTDLKFFLKIVFEKSSKNPRTWKAGKVKKMMKTLKM